MYSSPLEHHLFGLWPVIQQSGVVRFVTPKLCPRVGLGLLLALGRTFGALFVCDSSRIDWFYIDGQQPGYILLCILSTRDELDKARSASNSHRIATENTNQWYGICSQHAMPN